MKKMQYESPALLLLRLSALDLLATSGEQGDGTGEDGYEDSSDTL